MKRLAFILLLLAGQAWAATPTPTPTPSRTYVLQDAGVGDWSVDFDMEGVSQYPFTIESDKGGTVFFYGSEDRQKWHLERVCMGDGPYVWLVHCRYVRAYIPGKDDLDGVANYATTFSVWF